MRSFATLMAAAALAQTSMAHYCFNKLIVNGNSTGAYEYVRKNSNMNSPVTDVTSKDLICNVGGLSTGGQTSTYTVAPGDKVGFGLDTAITHAGPIQVYMSKAPGAASEYDGSGDWFKVYEMGAKVTATGLVWDSDQLTSFSFNLPKDTPKGQYFLRVEQIGLHSASTFEGAQFYISCAQIEVTGDGAGKPAPVVEFPGVYTGHEAGLELSLYYPIPTNYTFPGPAVWGGATGGGGSGSTAPASSSSVAASKQPVSTSAVSSVKPSSAAGVKTSASTLATSVRSSAAAASPSGGAQAARYAQCGGNDWTGATLCVSGSTCKALNPYYSQCV
jgi:hypothetical protein